MKQLLALLLAITTSFFNQNAEAQSFYAKSKKLYDYYGYFYRQTFEIKVEGLEKSVNENFGLESIFFSIHHNRVSDLKISLESPDGTNIWLTNRNGKEDGKHYLNTIISQYGKDGLINAASAPFTGNFIADGQIEFFNNNQNPNGIWKLYIEDLKKGEDGFLDSFKIIFSNNPAKTISKKKCSLENIGLCSCNNVDANCELLPDLVIIPYFTQTQIKEYGANDKQYPSQIRLAAAIGNIGLGPVEIKGANQINSKIDKANKERKYKNDNEKRLEVIQKIYSKNNNELSYNERKAGSMYFENKPGHNHYHVDDWVEFRLIQKVGEKKKLVCKGNKVSYCLFTNGRFHNNDSLGLIDGKIYNEDMPNYGLGFYPNCNPDKQGISVGGYDYYGLLYEGQYLQLPKNIKNGKYILEIEIDPNNWYAESNKKNNVFSMELELTKQNN